VAALIKQAHNLDVDLEPGSRGEFSLWIKGVKVAQKDAKGFPSDAALLQAVKQTLGLS
jgi:predicted Rdx family selenoprotein